MSKRINAALVVSAITFLVFANSVIGGFVWDDEQFVVKNTYLRSFQTLPNLLTENMVAGVGYKHNLYRPVEALTHWLDVRIWGYNPAGHHLTNVLLHAGLAAALFLVLAGIFSTGSALAAALVFSLHPLQSEAVAYVSGRGDILAMLFLCLGLIHAARRPWRALLFSALAMFSKERLVLFPAFLWLYDSLRGQKKSLPHYLPFAAVSALYLLSRLTVLNFMNTLNFFNSSNVFTDNFSYRALTYLSALPKSFLLWISPTDLHHARDWAMRTTWEPWAVAGLTLTLALFTASFFLRRRYGFLWVGILWYYVATFPTSNLWVVINALFYDHWFIFPGMGLMLILAGGLDQLKKFKPPIWKMALAITAVVLVPLAWNAVCMNRIWNDPVSLYSRLLKYNPDNAVAHNNLAMALAESGYLDNARAHYLRAIEVNDSFAQTHHNLANLYLAENKINEAREEYKKALAIDPGFMPSNKALEDLEKKSG